VSEPLRPCPFCGSEEVSLGKRIVAEAASRFVQVHCVECAECRVVGPYVLRGSEEEALDKWNTRDSDKESV